MLIAADASAAVRTWVATNGNWNTAANWSGGIVPTAGDDAGILGSSGLSLRSVNYDYTGPAVTLSFFRLDASIAANGPNALTQAANTLHTTTEQIGILANGRGVYSLSGGQNTIDGLLTLAANSASSGTYNLSGTGVVNAGSILVGDSGFGRFNQSGGQLFVFNAIRLGNGTGAGIYTMTGGTNVSISNLIVGGTGAGTVDQSAGLNGPNLLRLGEGTTSTGVYNLSGTASLGSSTVSIGFNGAGSFNHSAGSFNVTSVVELGVNSSGRGNYFLSGGSLAIAGGGAIELNVGVAGVATFTQSGGTVTITASTAGSGRMELGVGTGSTGTYLLSGNGRLETDASILVGGNGTGRFIQTGGTVIGDTITIGSQDGSSSYAMSGNSVVTATGVAVSGGSMNQSGGVVNVGRRAGAGGPEVVGDFITFSSYQLSGGSLNLYGREQLDGLQNILPGGTLTGVFAQTGGTHTVEGLFILGGDLAGIVPGGTGTYLLSGGRLTVNPAVLSAPSTAFSRGEVFFDDSLDGLRLLAGGTIVGGATDGAFSGKLTMNGGVIAGTFRNDGTILHNSGSISGTLLNRRALTLNNGVLVASMPISNEANALINGAGTILGGVSNRGEITPSGALAVSSISNIESGTINLPAGSSLRPDFVDNFSRISLAGGALLGAGSISNNANPNNGGGVIAGGGTVSLNIVQNGGTLRADDPARPLVITSPIVTTDAASQIVVAANSVLTLQSPLSNSAVLSLQSPGSRLTGATITNAGEISGAGKIENQVQNSGIIRAEAGALNFSNANNTNLSAGQIQTGSNTVRFSQGMQINSGTISLAGGEFDNGAGSMTSTGTIIGRGAIRAANLVNAGTFIFSGGTTDIFSPLTNQSRVTITGNSATTFIAPVNTSVGSINITLGSTAVFLSPVTGIGNITGPGTRDFESTANFGAINATGTTVVGPAGNLTASGIRDGTLRIFGHAAEVPDGSVSGTSRINELLIDGAPNNWIGQWDLADNALVIDYDAASPSPLATIANQIKSGFASGSWSGNGITSSSAAAAAGSAHKTALGFAESNQLFSSFPASFCGQSVDSSAVLVRYTLSGDANLSGNVDLTDFTFLAANFNGTSKSWLQGDFNYDQKVDLTDFTFLASNFNQSIPAGNPSFGVVVPEPATASSSAALVFATASLHRRRCRRRRRRHSASAADLLIRTIRM